MCTTGPADTTPACACQTCRRLHRMSRHRLHLLRSRQCHPFRPRCLPLRRCRIHRLRRRSRRRSPYAPTRVPCTRGRGTLRAGGQRATTRRMPRVTMEVRVPSFRSANSAPTVLTVERGTLPTRLHLPCRLLHRPFHHWAPSLRPPLLCHSILRNRPSHHRRRHLPLPRQVRHLQRPRLLARRRRLLRRRRLRLHRPHRRFHRRLHRHRPHRHLRRRRRNPRRRLQTQNTT